MAILFWHWWHITLEVPEPIEPQKLKDLWTKFVELNSKAAKESIPYIKRVMENV